MLSIHPNTIFTGKQFAYLKEIDSTNEELKRRLGSNGLSNGFLLAAGFQNSGKGQLNRKWESNPEKNILASVYYSRKMGSPKEQNALSFAVALAIFDTVAHCAKPSAALHIKWPNDILLNETKISGILIENIISGNLMHHIVGFGINVNQTQFNSKEKRTSLHLHQGISLNTQLILEYACTRLEHYYLMIRNPGGMQLIHRKYVERLYKRDEHILVGANEEKCLILGVDALGRLIIDRSGKQIALAHNEETIKWN